jgi:hypothetical protein
MTGVVVEQLANVNVVIKSKRIDFINSPMSNVTNYDNEVSIKRYGFCLGRNCYADYEVS